MSDKDTQSVDSPTFDPQTETYEQTYDAVAGSEIVTDAIVSVAEITGVSTTEMEPLGESVDVDALADVIETTTANDDPSATVKVEIHEHDVTIGGGRILIDPPGDAHC